jgi:dihydropteroate synthase
MSTRRAELRRIPDQTWTLCRRRQKYLVLDRPRLLAILNVTPDSFSDGGSLPTPDDAARAAERLVADGADALDVGGESTRPGSAPVGAEEQIRRVVPALDRIRRALGDSIPITVDTTLAEVAAAALDHGADAINDISAATHDTRMNSLAADRGAGIILMHRLTMPAQDSYSDRYAAAPDYGPQGVVTAVSAFLAERTQAALAAGIPPQQIVVDPGLGFGKSVPQNLELIMRTDEIASLGFPVLSGVSRKSFTARAAGMPGETPPHDRLEPTLALSVLHLVHGARLFRVHDVRAHARALHAAWAAMNSTSPASPPA